MDKHIHCYYFFFYICDHVNFVVELDSTSSSGLYPDKNAWLSSLVYSLFFVNYFDFEPVLDEVLSCPKGLHVWLVLPVATLVW